MSMSLTELKGNANKQKIIFLNGDYKCVGECKMIDM